jgi:hypothetical protein
MKSKLNYFFDKASIIAIFLSTTLIMFLILITLLFFFLDETSPLILIMIIPSLGLGGFVSVIVQMYRYQEEFNKEISEHGKYLEKEFDVDKLMDYRKAYIEKYKKFGTTPSNSLRLRNILERLDTKIETIKVMVGKDKLKDKYSGL